MGMPYRDYFDYTLPKHTDYTDKIGSTNLFFRWAPFSVNQAKALRKISTSPKTEYPDIVILGGGSWDRLHVFDSDPVHTKLKKEVEDLSQQINLLTNDIPIVWTIPTMIHDKGLQDENKLQHIKENQLDEMRQMQ